MIPLKKCIAIKALLLTLLWTCGLARAETVVASVRNLSGAMLLQKADGSTRALAVQSLLEPGDTLRTQKRSYAQIQFSDASLLTLQPDTVLRIDQFVYDPDKPAADQAAFTLSRGGVRVNQGLLGQRSKDRVLLKTPVAEVGVQGSALVQYVEPTEQALSDARRAYLLASTAALALDDSPVRTYSDVSAPLLLAQLNPPTGLPGPTRAPGLYVSVIDGLISVSNKGGATNFSAGQFGYTANLTQPPVIVPRNPGIQFTPPPAFSAPTPTNSSSPAKSSTVDCEVR